MSRNNKIEKRKIKSMKLKASSLKKIQFNKTDKPQDKMIRKNRKKLAILGMKEGYHYSFYRHSNNNKIIL